MSHQVAYRMAMESPKRKLVFEQIGKDIHRTLADERYFQKEANCEKVSMVGFEERIRVRGELTRDNDRSISYQARNCCDYSINEVFYYIILPVA
eukprot:1384175-Amorphochlora_amoeboformis.AAC.1